MKFKTIVSWGALAGALVLSGCASYQPVPQGYAGPTAVIKDSFRVVSGSKIEFFYLEAVDGHDVENSRSASLKNSRGMGMRIKAFPIHRAVPTTPQSFSIVARTEYAAPILAMTRAVYEVKGVVQLTPEAGKSYVVKGALGDAASEVWLEDEASQQVIGDKIKPTGSAKLGFFEK